MDSRFVRFAWCAALAALLSGPGTARAAALHGSGVKVVTAGAGVEASGVALLGLGVLGVAAIVRRRIR